MPGETTAKFERRCRHCGNALSATSSFCSKCGATAEPVRRAGDPLRERLQALFGADLDIERELGRGGMAAVYAGYDPALQRRVAVKVLLPEISNDRAMAERFLREARTVAALQHPHVVTVYAVRSGDGVHAIVMQLVEGRSLDAVLKDGVRVPVHVAGMLLSQAAAGLQHAHDRGVIHRDVKPANVLIDADGRAIVSDFGIARREDGPRTTETGLVVGTWAYMSPEQRSADAITPATDQYALGVMAFELLTGRLPFMGTPSEMLHAHMHEPPPSIRALRPDAPEGVDAAVQRMLAKAPNARFPSMRDPERIFKSLVPDEGQTTLQLAAFSHVRAGAGSRVVAAAPRPPAASLSRPAAGAATAADARSSSTAAAEAAVAAVAGEAAEVRPRGRSIAATAGGALAGLALVVVAIVLLNRDGASPTVAGGDTGAAGDGARTAPSRVGLPASAGADEPQAPGEIPNAPAPRGGSADRLGGAGVPRSADANRPIDAAGNASVAAPTGAITAAPLASARADTMARAPIAAPPADANTRTAAPPPAPPIAEAPRATAAVLADARRVGREFVTLLNQRRYRELGALQTVGGDPAARAELLRLVESAADFSAGFDRLPVAPEPWTIGFETELYVDVQWRGGSQIVRVRLYCLPADGGWRLAGIAVDRNN